MMKVKRLFITMCMIFGLMAICTACTDTEQENDGATEQLEGQEEVVEYEKEIEVEDEEEGVTEFEFDGDEFEE